jgi:hypothetical protein
LPSTWRLAKEELSIVASGLFQVMKTIETESPTLVEVTGPDLVSNLTSLTISRSIVVGQLVAMPEPLTSGEHDALRRLVDRYEGLIINLRRLNTSLNHYIQRFQI